MHLIVAKLTVLGAPWIYWSRGYDGFTKDRSKATEFETVDDAYAELYDYDLTDIAEVRTLGVVG